MSTNTFTDWSNPVAARERLASLKLQHEQAAKQLMDGVKSAFPVGSMVSAVLGNAVVVGRVTGHSWCHWHEPDSFTIENIKTGKLRKVNATSKLHDATLVG